MKKNKNLIAPLILSSIFAAVSFLPLQTVANAHALSTTETAVVDVENATFENGTSQRLSSASSWSKINDNNSSIVAGVIDTSTEAFTAYGKEGSSSSYFQINKNPGTQNSSQDDHILMINAKDKSLNMGYQSEAIALDANSFFEISFFAAAENNSIYSAYLTGLGEFVASSATTINGTGNFENPKSSWQKHTFYVATGLLAETINLEFWLGSKEIQSSGAVFFDNVTVTKMSERLFGSKNTTKNSITIENRLIERFNYNENSFPIELTEDTKNVSASGIKVFHHELSNEINGEVFGTNFSSNTSTGLVLSAEKSAVFGVQTPSFSANSAIAIPVVNRYFSNFVFTFDLKLSSDFDGSAFVKIVEDGLDDDSTEEPQTFESPKISSNSTNDLRNNFQTLTFCVSTKTLSSTSFHFELWMDGVGTVVFNEINTYLADASILAADFENKTEAKFLDNAGTPSIANGKMNDFELEFIDDTSSYVSPFKPSSFTITKDESVLGNNVLTAGIISSMSDSQEANNVLEIKNDALSFQRVETAEITLAENKQYVFQFDAATNTDASFALETTSGTILLTESDFVSTSLQTKSFAISTQNTSLTVKLVMTLGTEENPACGWAQFDNLKMKEQTSIDGIANSITIDGGIFHSANTTKETSSQPLFLKSTLEEGSSKSIDAAVSGILVNGHSMFSLPEEFENTNQNILAIKTLENAKQKYVSTLPLTFEAETPQKITVWAKTNFSSVTEDEAGNIETGISFGDTSNSNVFSAINTNGEWQEFIFITKDAESFTPFFTLETQNGDTGCAFFTMPVVTSITTAEFNKLALEPEKEFSAGNVVNLSSDVDDEDVDDENTDAVNPGSQFDFLLIPSIILAISIIIAIVGFSVRRIKFKRSQHISNAEYDRSETLEPTVLRREAEAEIAIEIKELKSKIAEAEKEIQNLETAYSATLENHRNQRESINDYNAKIALDVAQEKVFKKHSASRKKIENKILVLKEHLKSASSIENLISVERKIEKKQLKAQKKQLSAAKKLQKSDEE